MSLELDIFNKLMRQKKENDHVAKNTWSCDGCVFEPPSSCDGKPCSACEPSDPFMSCFVAKLEEDAD